MLDKFEKICHGFCCLALLAVASCYLIWPVPDTDPEEFLKKSKQSAKPPTKLTTRKEGAEAPIWTVVENTKKKNEVIKKLRAADPRISSKDLQEKYMEIRRDSFKFIKNEANWVPELKQVAKSLHQNRDGSMSLEITRIRTGSILTRVFGLEAGDRIELLNGERCDFSDDSTFSNRTKAKEILQTIENGGSASITIMRNGAPQQMTFSLE